MSTIPENNENREIRLIDIVKVCLRFKYVIIAITLAVCILGTLFIQVFYNKENRRYVSNFALYYSELPAIVNTDGSVNFASDEIVDALKENDALKSIDFNRFKEGNMGIMIDRNWTEDRLLYANFPYKIDAFYYTMAIRTHNFSSEEQALIYVEAIAKAAISSNREKIESLKFDNYLRQVDTAESFEKEMSYLQNQASSITASYDKLIEIYKDSLVVVGGDTLRNRLDDIKIRYNQMNFTELREMSERNSYVKFFEVLDEDGNPTGNYEASPVYKSSVNEQLNSKKEELEKIEVRRLEAEARVNAPSGNATIDSAAYNDLKTLTLEKQELEKDIERLAKSQEKMSQVVSEDNAAILETKELREKLTAYKQELSELLEIYKQDILYIYDQDSRVIFESSKIIEIDGGFGLIISVLLTFVIGFVLSLLVVFFINTFKKSKKEMALEKASIEEEKVKESK